MKNKILLIMPLLFFTTIGMAQIKIGASTGAPNAGAILEVESTNRGFLLPRIALTSNTMTLNSVTPPNGMMVFNTNTSTAGGLAGTGLYVWNGQWTLILESSAADPAGSYKLSAANSMTGYLLCDGSAVSRTTYAALYAVIGTTFGAGDGSSTFNLPDFRGRVFGGVGSGTGLTTRSLGNTIGSEAVTLNSNNMPYHRHRTSLAAAGNDGSFGNTGSTSYTESISGTPNQNASVAYTDYSGSNSPLPFSIIQPTLYAGNTFIKF
ncbi:phage tail protein [Pedobacter sp. KLB.chiD]|uniref:phage tail protein n=1 Tax=Pedobacter sp. KLB.chiD TaxID=3387402 RepID=UPI003999BEEA